MTSPEQLAELAVHHQQWQQNTVTKHFSVLLDDMEKKLVDFISLKSTDKTIDDREIRQWAAQIQNTKQIKQLIYDTRKFTNKFTSHSNNSHSNS